MSVLLKSPNGEIEEGICNGSWAAAVACARAYGENVPPWNGCHDGQVYTPDHLKIIATRAKQLAHLTELFEDLAANGGTTIN